VASGSATLTSNVSGTGPFGRSTLYGNVATGDVALSPGTYWMNLAPQWRGHETFLMASVAGNGVNPVIDRTSYVIGTYWASVEDIGRYDFSYGVDGVVADAPVPEPSSLALLALGLTATIRLGRRRLACCARY